jgi:hypothetical protein
MHTLLDLQGNIPTFISVTNGKVHDVNILDEIVLEAGAFYVMDRGYVDFERLYVFTTAVLNKRKSCDPCCRQGLCVPGDGIPRLRSTAVS